MRETYLEPDWWNLGRERAVRRPHARAMFSSEPPNELEPTAWHRPELRSLGATELSRGRRIPVRGESPRDESPPREAHREAQPESRDEWHPEPETELQPASFHESQPESRRQQSVERHESQRESRPEWQSEPQPTHSLPASDDLAEMKQQARAALAELEAARRRVERDADRQREAIRAAVLAELLPVLDDLQRSLGAAAGKADDGLLSGLALVRDGFEKVLARFGAERIVAEGAQFDPSVHEALGVMPITDPAEDGRVVKEWLPGYRLGDRVLRPAQVMVGKR